MRFTADLAFSMFESVRDEQVLVVFAEANTSAKTFAYLVDDNGPTIARGPNQLQRSKTDDFLPVELAVPYHLNLLIATVKGTEPPPLPDFDPGAVGSKNEDYIDATGLDDDNPDGLVFAATTGAAVGLTVWMLTRRKRYAWRVALTQSPELVRRHGLVAASHSARKPLPEPADPNEEELGPARSGRTHSRSNLTDRRVTHRLIQ